MEKLSFEDGKYQLILDAGEFTALRHGQPWRDLTGDKLVYTMFAEIQRLQVELVKGAAQHRMQARLTAEAQESLKILRAPRVPNGDMLFTLCRVESNIEHKAVCWITKEYTSSVSAQVIVERAAHALLSKIDDLITAQQRDKS